MGSAFDEDPFKTKDPFGGGGSQPDPFAADDPFKSSKYLRALYFSKKINKWC
jgi:hypothetical protein